MKSKTSLFNKAVFKRDLRGNIALWVGLLLLYLIHIPVVFFNVARIKYDGFTTVELEEIHRSSILEVLQTLIVETPVYAIIGVVVAISLFAYLYTAKHANMIHTFPVSRKSLFITHYVSALCIMFVPMALSMLIGDLVCIGYGVDVGLVPLKTLLFMMGETFFFFNLALCVVMFVGNVIAGLALYGILNFLYLGIEVIAKAIAATVCYGLGQNFSVHMNPLTPSVYMYQHLSLNQNPNDVTFSGEKILLLYCVAALVLGCIAYITYQKKQLETAGDVITVGWFKPVFRWGVTVCGAVVATLFTVAINYADLSTAPMAVIFLMVGVYGLVLFFVAQMLLERSWRVFQKKRIIEGVVCVVCICLAYLAMEQDFFGIEKYIPKAEEISYAMISGNDLAYLEGDDVKKVTDLHQEIIDSKKEFERYPELGNTVSEYIEIKYFLKNGKTVYRAYVVPASESYWDNTNSVISKTYQIIDAPNQVANRIWGVHGEDAKAYSGTFDYDWSEENGGNQNSKELTSEQADALLRAYLQDAQEGNAIEGYRSNKEDYVYFAEDLCLELYSTGTDVYSCWYSKEDAVFEEIGEYESTVYVPLHTEMKHVLEAMVQTGIIEKIEDLHVLEVEEY